MARPGTVQETLEVLGYSESKNFMPGDSSHLASAVDYAHVFRKAVADCALRGVYTLRPDPGSVRSITPVVYVCEAADQATADKIHKRVWNQNIVPFLLVHTPQSVRLYSGFQYGVGGEQDAKRGVLKHAIAFNEIASQLASFTANAIDTGRLWKEWGEQVTPDTRVDWQLLANLRDLDAILRQDGLDRATSHALIGKFVYLRYLRDRDILSDRKLDKWGIRPDAVFTRDAVLNSFWKVNDELEDWLNGAVFPLTTRKDAIKAAHVKKVAGVFFGDQPTGQLHLDFSAYDFAFIPTETLSSIYEQFLHSPEESEQAKGKQSGAYYTPVPLVNFVLSELDHKCPLQEGMKVLDPACGSGAFLVQSYRRLISYKRHQTRRYALRLTELRDLLTKHIYGVELDGDACQVTALSLILTLLDCVEPPDLENTTFKLPSLRNENIFESDFFDPNSAWATTAASLTFDWVIGNPPWKDLKASKAPHTDRYAWEWMRTHSTDCPVGGNQLAEAFLWKAIPVMGEDAVAGLVLPAMTLFKRESECFRRTLFERHSVWCVANFANFAEVLFGGRARRPAAVLFYQRSAPAPDARILTYAPFVLNQEASRASRSGARKTTWNIVVNASELRELRLADVSTGCMLPWKLAMWGSHRDEHLLQAMQSRFESFEKFAARHGLLAYEGVQLRHPPATEEEKNTVEHLPQLVGKTTVVFKKLHRCGRVFRFPHNCLDTIPQDKAYLRKRGGRAGLDVSRPPHIILDAARRFAVYSDDFILVPPRQIGIAGPADKRDVLIALSLYLNSSFAKYYQFYVSPGWGIDTSIAILDALFTLPIPLDSLTSRELKKWVSLHGTLTHMAARDVEGQVLASGASPAPSIATLDSCVYSLLGLNSNEVALIEDLTNTKLDTLQGKIPKEASRIPTTEEMTAYLHTLQHELDDFVGTNGPHSHCIEVVQGNGCAMLSIALTRGKHKASRRAIHKADSTTAQNLEQVRQNLLRRHSQWLYFERTLKIYDGSSTYLFKPMQRIHWTHSQALLDADEVIAETLVGAEG